MPAISDQDAAEAFLAGASAEVFLAGFSAACFLTSFLAGLLTASGAEADLAAAGADAAPVAAIDRLAPNRPAATHKAVMTDFMRVPFRVDILETKRWLAINQLVATVSSQT